MNRIGETTKALFVENKSMNEDLKLQMQEVAKLKMRLQVLEDENKRLTRDVELKDETVREYAVLQSRRREQVRKDSMWWC